MITEDRKRLYINLIKSSFSLREVCIKAGIVATTGNYNTLKRIIKENNLDITHFKRQNGGNNTSHKIEFYLKKDSNISSFKLKNKLFKEGLKEQKCECCGLSEWMGQPIKLELHHINGDNTDNRLEILQILCPNCHSYTDNYGGKNQKMNIKKKNIKPTRIKINSQVLQNLLNETDDLETISKTIGVSKQTLQRYIRKYNLLVKEKTPKFANEVPNMIALMKVYKNYTKVGKILGISDNAVKKRFKSLGYPVKIKELIQALQ